ncbi:MYLK2 kinase, partial [Eudromia elegans]|nr:MYLK2 kinase [Eudromia elegans]
PGSGPDAAGDQRKPPPDAPASAALMEPVQNGTPAAATDPRGAGDGEPAKEAAPAAAHGPDGGKAEPGKEDAEEPQGGETEPLKEKGPAAAEPTGEGAPAPGAAAEGSTEPAEGKDPAATEALHGAKEKAPMEEAPHGAKEKAPMEEAPHGEKAPSEEAPAAGEAEDGEKTAPVETTAVVKAQGGEEEGLGPKALAKAEATGGKAEPAEDAALAAAPAPHRDQEGPAAEEAPAAAPAPHGGQEGPVAEEAPSVAPAPHGGKDAAQLEEGAEVQKRPQGSEPARPVLQQSLSCPASCQRALQPCTEVVAMEKIPEEAPDAQDSATAPALEPQPAPGEEAAPAVPAPGGAVSQQDRTLAEPAGEPGDTEKPPGAPAPRPEAEPPPSPYLTPDFGKDDPFEILDDVPPPPAPFAHRIVTLRSANVSAHFNLSTKDILGGGKFGEVHTCTEKQTGLKLAAKVIRKQGAKDKEMVLLEIDVMNQLNHRNLIQLYDAIETPREIILFMEFVEGGELFERIIDDDYHLTEVDCMVFVRQICEGIRFMHHMRVLHLDLKPENILCVTATGHMVKIIDFGLARRYNPEEKLKVNFGTPEFLSPEVVNYEQVSYATDMWSMGVITYMLLSGLSPFLGDNDTETLNNVLAANWYFDEETFESVSEEAKDFVSNLIIKEKSARLSAGQCLQHPWLNSLAEKAKRSNRRLKSQVLLKKYVMRRRWKKNFIGVCAANRFRKITSSGSLTALGV